jgi:hypothetical protein
MSVASGQHKISVNKTGFKRWERRITVSSGQVNVNATLEAERPTQKPTDAAPASTAEKPGSQPNQSSSSSSATALSSEPSVRPAVASATEVHSSQANQVPPPESAVLPVKAASSDAKQEPSDSAAQPSTARAAASSSAIEGEGTASITSDPDGAQIFVDSVLRGTSPTLLKLKPGIHKIQLVADGYKDWVRDIEVKNSSIVNVTGTLQK